jgi:hypothetical protein
MILELSKNDLILIVLLFLGQVHTMLIHFIKIMIDCNIYNNKDNNYNYSDCSIFVIIIIY